MGAAQSAPGSAGARGGGRRAASSEVLPPSARATSAHAACSSVGAAAGNGNPQAAPASSSHDKRDDDGLGTAGAHLADAAADAQAAARYRATCAALERVLAERAASNARLRTRADAQRRAAAEALAAAAAGDDAAAPPPPEAAAVAAAATGGGCCPQRSYWAGPPTPADDDARLRAVDAFGLLADAVLPDDDDDDDDDNHNHHRNNHDGPSSSSAASFSVRAAIDGALRLVCSVFGVDEAVIALFGDRRIYVRDVSARSAFRRGDMPWRWSFCWWTLSPPQPTALVVRDVLADARFAANSVARAAGVRFYCGVPLLAPGGHRLGVLSFASPEPRPDFDAASVAVASNMAELVARELAREVAAAMRARASLGARLRSEREASAPVLVIERVVDEGDEEQARWLVRHANSAFCEGRWRQTRADPASSTSSSAAAATPPLPPVAGADLWRELFDASEVFASPLAARAVASAVAAGQPFAIAGARLRPRSLGKGARDDDDAAAALTTTFTLRFTPAAAPGALAMSPPSSSSMTSAGSSSGALSGSGGGGAMLTAAPAFCPDAPPDPATRARLAALWFLDVEHAAAAGTAQGTAAAPGHPAGADAAAAAAAAAFVAAAVPPAALQLPGGRSLPAAPRTTPAAAAPPLVAGPASPVAAPLSATFPRVPGRFSSEAAPGLPPSLRGLELGSPLASGSHGRVFRGRYHGARVAVKVLDAADWLSHNASTSAAGVGGGGVEAGPSFPVPLEASLGERLRHPFVVQTLAWGVVGDPAAALPARPRVWTRVAASSSASGSGGANANNDGSGGAATTVVRHGELLFPSEEEEDSSEGAGDDEEDGSGPQALRPNGHGRRSRRPKPNPQTWLVLELCDRGSLQDAIDAGWLRTSRDPLAGAPHLPAILATAREVAAAMAYVHGEGAAHGDLSAWNVMLQSSPAAGALGGRGWCAKVGDFGLAVRCGGGGGGGGGGVGGGGGGGGSEQPRLAGTITHCAPELLAPGGAGPSPAADVYAFGVILWQLWTGARPWHGLTHAQIARAVGGEGGSLAWPEDAPEGLAALGEACLSRDPAERPSFLDVLEVLDPVLEVLEESGVGGGGGGES